MRRKLQKLAADPELHKDLNVPARLSREYTPYNAAHDVREVPRRHISELTPAQFKEEFERPRIPVILQGLQTPVHWTPDWFRQRYADRQIVLNVGTEDEEAAQVGEFLDFIEGKPHASWTPTKHAAPYLRNLHLSEYFPELFQELDSCWAFFAPNWFTDPVMSKRISWLDIPKTWKKWAELFIGTAGSQLPYLHYDNMMTAGFAAQLYGEKTYFFWPPHATPNIYPGLHGARNMSFIRDIHNVDASQYPMFAELQPIEATVRAGEVLWVPPGWWHITRQNQINISVGGNYMNALNATDFFAEVREFMKENHGLCDAEDDAEFSSDSSDYSGSDAEAEEQSSIDFI